MTSDQRRSALITANERKREVGRLRTRLKNNREFAEEILRNPPPEAARLAVIEVLVHARSQKGWRSECLMQIGNRAVADRINLLVPLGRASERTREWAATEGLRWARDARGRTRSGERVAA